MSKLYDLAVSQYGAKPIEDVPKYTDLRIINNITKVYPNMIQVVVYKQPLILKPHKVGKRREVHIDDQIVPSTRSIRRSRSNLRDLILCNDFEWFCTFTMSSKCVNRYDAFKSKRIITTWLANQKARYSPDLKYIVVPEAHKDGALHYHALIGNFYGPMYKTKHVVSGRTVYNLTCYRAGYSTAVRIDNKEAVSNYVRKYITKELTAFFGKKRYFASRNLNRPQKFVNSDILSKTKPLFKRKTYDGGDYDLYSVLPF